MDEFNFSGKDLARKLQIDFDSNFLKINVLNKINQIKLQDRPELKLTEWNQKQFHSNRTLAQLWNIPKHVPTVQMIDGNKVSLEDFRQNFDQKNKPCIIQNLAKEWNVDQFWTFKYLYEQYGKESFKIGEDDDGNKLKIKLESYLQYLICNVDDSPLYLFESSLENLAKGAKIIDQYQVPEYFRDDYFSLAGEKARPPYRWLIIGFLFALLNIPQTKQIWYWYSY